MLVKHVLNVEMRGWAYCATEDFASIAATDAAPVDVQAAMREGSCVNVAIARDVVGGAAHVRD